MTIKLERYAVYNYSVDGTITSYAVSRDKDDPDLVLFKVTGTYPRAEQKQRADEYCAYLNKIVDATEEAYSQNQLVDTLKR